ncbi:MAG: hypothetical protein AABM32_04805 [Chloroflexota bacterium]
MEAPLYRCLPRGWPDVAEPVERWLHFARQTRAILSIAAALHQGKQPNVKDWATALEDIKPAEARVASASKYAKDADWSRYALGAFVDQRLLLAGARPAFRWPNLATQPTLELQLGTFGALSMQLAIAITKTHDLVLCSGCGQAYTREKRKAQSGRRNYCPTCHERGIPERDRKRSEAIRLREKRAKIGGHAQPGRTRDG